ncbi:MAG: acetolactate synthase large subunit, partial [Streptosporangiaceae bacterium]
MNGARALAASLVGAGVDVCFMNPGTSEMHFVAALDAVPRLRGVLTLFEGVATGAADGYARMAGKPAAVLLHLGPGLGNGLANLHNARRAGSPMVVIVGTHATGHVRYDAPLQSDIEALARTVSGWVHTSGTTRDLARDTMRAVEAAARGQIATLVLPADVSWSDGGAIAPPRPTPSRPIPPVTPITPGPATTFLLGGNALTERGLRAASRIRAATGARLLAEAFPARMERGAGLPAVERLAYLAERAEAQLAGTGNSGSTGKSESTGKSGDTGKFGSTGDFGGTEESGGTGNLGCTRELVLAGARAPVSFFAYPDRASDLVPDGCAVTALA